MLEALAVLGGLAAGWLIVSLVFEGMRPSVPPAPLITPDLDLERDWPMLLDVPGDASEDALRLAYERQMAALARAAPGIMTRHEALKQAEARRALDQALHHALNLRGSDRIADPEA